MPKKATIFCTTLVALFCCLNLHARTVPDTLTIQFNESSRIILMVFNLDTKLKGYTEHSVVNDWITQFLNDMDKISDSIHSSENMIINYDPHRDKNNRMISIKNDVNSYEYLFSKNTGDANRNNKLRVFFGSAPGYYMIIEARSMNDIREMAKTAIKEILRRISDDLEDQKLHKVHTFHMGYKLAGPQSDSIVHIGTKTHGFFGIDLYFRPGIYTIANNFVPNLDFKVIFRDYKKGPVRNNFGAGISSYYFVNASDRFSTDISIFYDIIYQRVTRSDPNKSIELSLGLGINRSGNHLDSSWLKTGMTLNYQHLGVSFGGVFSEIGLKNSRAITYTGINFNF